MQASSRFSDNHNMQSYCCEFLSFSPSAFEFYFCFVCLLNLATMCTRFDESLILFTYFSAVSLHISPKKAKRKTFKFTFLKARMSFMLNNWEQQTWNVAWNEWLSSQRNNIIRPSLVSDFVDGSKRETEKRVRCLSVRFQFWLVKRAPTIDTAAWAITPYPRSTLKSFVNANEAFFKFDVFQQRSRSWNWSRHLCFNIEFDESSWISDSVHFLSSSSPPTNLQHESDSDSLNSRENS
jgi:hypothetical protein